MSARIIDGIDYGPLAGLIGRWSGDRGVDRAPEPEGEERSPFHETLLFEACAEVDNAQQQFLVVLRYHQVVRRKSNDKVFHNESGYWSWDRSSGVLMQTLAIPRGVALVAGGEYPARDVYEGEIVLEVRAALGDPDWPVAQSPFMRDKASTVAFSHRITLNGDQLAYTESTLLRIYGREYKHTDLNHLQRQH